MAKKNKQIQDQLQEGLKQAEQTVDVQLEGKPAPKAAPQTTPPAAAAPSAPAAGGTTAAPAQVDPQQVVEANFEAEIAKLIKSNRFFVDRFRQIRDGIAAGDDAMGLNQKLLDFAKLLSNASGGKIPTEAINGFLSEKLFAQNSPAVLQAASSAPSPEIQPGVVQTPPTQETLASVAPTPLPGDPSQVPTPVIPPEVLQTRQAMELGLDENGYIHGGDFPFSGQIPALDAWFDSLSPEQLAAWKNRNNVEAVVPGASETQVTATTPDQAGGITEDQLAMLREADAQMASQRPDVGLDRAEARYFGAKGGSGESDSPIYDRFMRSFRAPDAETLALVREMERKSTIKRAYEEIHEIIDSRALTPEDKLYLLYERYLSSEDGIKMLLARNMLRDPEGAQRGYQAMRLELFHYALGYIGDERNEKTDALRKEFDAILRSLGIDDDVIKGVRGDIKATRDSDWTPPYYGTREEENVALQRRMIDKIVATVQELKDGGTLRRPDVAPALHTLIKLITDIDSDILNDRTVKFDPTEAQGQTQWGFARNLEHILDSIAEKIKAETGEDIRVVTTEKGDIPRPSWSTIQIGDQVLTANNIVNYQIKSRRRYALDRAGLIDPRWQQVDVQGLDVPSFVNTLHPELDSTKAAIGFILTSDPTATLQHATPGARRDFDLEGYIIKALKQHLNGTAFDDSSRNWDERLTFDGDIGVGDNITYTTDSAVVDSEVARRRLLLPQEPVVIAKVDRNKFDNLVISDGKGSSRLLGPGGIMVLAADSPLVDVVLKNGGAVTPPFKIGSPADISAIVKNGVFPTLHIDIDPHVFPAVRHSLPLVDPMNRRGTVALVPRIFLSPAPEGARVTTRDKYGIPTRSFVYQRDKYGNVITASAAQSSKSFSGRGPQSKIGDLPMSIIMASPDLQKKYDRVEEIRLLLSSGTLAEEENVKLNIELNKLQKYFQNLSEIMGPQVAGIEDIKPGTTPDGLFEGRPAMLVRTLDATPNDPDWPSGISTAIVADTNGNLPNIGTLADRYLEDTDEPGVRRRWVVGDMLGLRQGDDRERGGVPEDSFYGRRHGAITDAELERGRALMRQIDEEIAAGVDRRDVTKLTPEEQDLVDLARSTMQESGGARSKSSGFLSPARNPYDAADAFESSEDEWHVKHRELRDARTPVPTEPDPFLSGMSEEGEFLSFETMDAETARKVRVLKADLLTLLRIRATKAFWDRRNTGKAERKVKDIQEFAAELGAIRQELDRVGVTEAAYEKIVLDALDMITPVDAPARAALREELAKDIKKIETTSPTRVTSIGGYGVSRGFGPENLTFLVPEELGLNPLSDLDMRAYAIAQEMTMEHLAARTGGPMVSLETIFGGLGDDSTGTEDNDFLDSMRNVDPDLEKVLNLAANNPEAFRELNEETRAVVDELRRTKDPMFKALLISLIEERGDISAVEGSAYPREFAMAVLQQDKAKPEPEREFKPRGKKDKLTRGRLPDGSSDPYDARMQELWVEYVRKNRSNVARKLGKTVRRKMTGPTSATALAADLAGAMPSPKLPKPTHLSGLTRDEIRIVAEKAYTAFSIFAARDDAGDGWVKFVNSALHADESVTQIANDWAANGRRTLLVESREFADPRTGEVPEMRTQSGSDVGVLTRADVNRLRATPRGQSLIEFAEDNQLDFVLFKKRSRQGTTDVRAEVVEQVVYIVKLSERNRKNPSLPLELDDLDNLTQEYGYQPLGSELDASQSEERIKALLEITGANDLFTVVLDPSGSGRYMLVPNPDNESFFSRIERQSKNIQIKLTKLELEVKMKLKFYQDINAIAAAAGAEIPYPDVSENWVREQVSRIQRESKGINSGGETSGPFGIRIAMNTENKNLPVGVIPEVISEEVVGKGITLEEKLLRELSYISSAPEEGVDPMLDAGLRDKTIRGKRARRLLTAQREAAVEGTKRRIETESTLALARRARAMLKAGRINTILGSRGAGLVAGLGLIPLTMPAGMSQSEAEDAAKVGVAFEALGAVSPVASSAAALGFTAMNRGDMLRTIINILGGIGGATVGAAGGTLVMPVGGSFAGGIAGSVAGSHVADAIYSQIAGGSTPTQQVPYNIATDSEPAVPEEKDPFSVFKGLGG